MTRQSQPPKGRKKAPAKDGAAAKAKSSAPKRAAAGREPPAPTARASATVEAPAAKVSRVKVPFPRKNQQPTESEFMARLPLATGKKFEVVRSFLQKQRGVVEELYYYGPKTGWAFRYLQGARSLATIMIHDDRLMGIVSLDGAAFAAVDFAAMSEVGQRARKMAHGSPTLLWLDMPLDGSGAADFKTLLKTKLKSPPPPPPPPPPRAPPAARR